MYNFFLKIVDWIDRLFPDPKPIGGNVLKRGWRAKTHAQSLTKIHVPYYTEEEMREIYKKAENISAKGIKYVN